MALFRRSAEPTRSDPEPVEPVVTSGQAKKDRPTPTRKAAEAARRQRVHRTLTPKEARREAGRQNRASRMRAIVARDSAPEKQLMRDYVDARFSLGEFLLPSLVVILAFTFLGSVVPNVAIIATVVMYTYILFVLLDCFLMWRGFKRVIAERLPNVSTRGLPMYGMNRMIQIRRFRIPAPRIKRGDAY